ncbi:50S ribosomal protein L18e [Candidatus Bathyarchaeota archaeon]|nr:50S ribosomal protein L18e [Candidatus Bathyarchaeota archaeon]
MRRILTNPELNDTIAALKRTGRKNKSRIWLRAAELLSKPRRSRIAVNVSRISRNTKKGDVVAVAGKVLSAGSMSHAVRIGAFSFSQAAKAKIEKAGGSCVSLTKLADDHPKGSKVRILR